MRKNYKEKQIYIGDSDIATLILVGIGKERNDLVTHLLHFGMDGNYKAWLIDDSVEVPEHYILEKKFIKWLKIYDDSELTQELRGKTIEIYTAGEMGCLIKIIK